MESNSRFAKHELNIRGLYISYCLIEGVNGPDSSGSPQGGTTEDYKRIAGPAGNSHLKILVID